MDRVLEFTGNHVVLVTALLVSFFLLVFTELRRKAAGTSSVEPIDAVRLINNDALVVDLRSTEAFGRGHIVNAKNVPADELEAKMDTLAKFKSKPIVAVCDAGMSSGKAVKKLRESGFESVYGLKGGMAAWNQAGMPVVTGRKTRSRKQAQG